MPEEIPIEQFDSLEMHADVDYSATIADILGSAYSLIKEKRYEEARDLIKAHADQPMSRAQRLRVNWVRVMAEIGLQQLDEAEEALGWMMLTAVELEARDAIASAAFLFGETMREHQLFESGLEYFEMALDMLHEREHYDHAFELDLLALIASQRFMLGKYTAAEEAVRQAREVALHVADPTLSLAKADWVGALLCRWGGRLAEAQGIAERLYGVYKLYNSRTQIGRISLVLADIQMDIAAQFNQGAALRKKYFDTLSGVSQYILDALTMAREIGDPGCEGLALLANARLRRAFDASDDVLPLIAEAEQIAVETKDAGLLGQVYTAFGDAMLARGDDQDVQEARTWYTEAIKRLRSTGAIALTVWPLRGLERLDRGND
ncbi:MAG: hypothetical protein OJF49_003948 [Ktedonobacterales bacterium]|jgi:tetratricopeptide (TPR) repeat protein|nr:MAG: hypothetical protein OJF49_003948 [Ktedonobacterales bacterium]